VSVILCEGIALTTKMSGIDEQLSQSSIVISTIVSNVSSPSDTNSSKTSVLSSSTMKSQTQLLSSLLPSSLPTNATTTPSNIDSRPEASFLARAPSNLELLSLTAAWQEGHDEDGKNSSKPKQKIENGSQTFPKSPSKHNFCSNNTATMTTNDKTKIFEPEAKEVILLASSLIFNEPNTVAMDDTSIIAENFSDKNTKDHQVQETVSTEEMHLPTNATTSLTSSQDKQFPTLPSSSSATTTVVNHFNPIGNTRSLTPVDHIIRSSSFLPPPLSASSTFSYVHSPTGCQYGFIVGIADTDTDNGMPLSSPMMKNSQSFLVQVPNTTTPVHCREYDIPKLPSELYLFGAAYQERPQQYFTNSTSIGNFKDMKTDTHSPATITTTTSTNSTITTESDYNAMSAGKLSSSSSLYAKREQPSGQKQHVNDHTNMSNHTTVALPGGINERLTSTSHTTDTRMIPNLSSNQQLVSTNDSKNIQGVTKDNMQSTTSIQTAFQPPRTSTLSKKLSSIPNVSLQRRPNPSMIGTPMYQSFVPSQYTAVTDGKMEICASNQAITTNHLQTTEMIATTSHVDSTASGISEAPSISDPNLVLSWQQQFPNAIAGLQATLQCNYGSYPNSGQLMNTSNIEHRQTFPTSSNGFASDGGGGIGRTIPQIVSTFAPSCSIPSLPPQPSPGSHVPITSSNHSESDFTLVAAAAAGRENVLLRQTLVELHATIKSLQDKVEHLESENSQLRQLPTGKISQIPIE
jgi:hypothetical protein